MHWPVVAVLSLAACSAAPDYPSDWTRLASPVNVEGGPCPDLSGDYLLPGAIQARIRKGKDRVVHTTSFLTATAGKAESGRVTSNIALSRMVLEGPSADGLRVVFYDRKGAVLSAHRLRAGTDYVCRGAWISDARRDHTRASPPHFYAKDVDGRLIGHIAYAGAGIVPILGVIPVPAFVDDRIWWRIEPAMERP